MILQILALVCSLWAMVGIVMIILNEDKLKEIKFNKALVFCTVYGGPIVLVSVILVSVIFTHWFVSFSKKEYYKQMIVYKCFAKFNEWVFK